MWGERRGEELHHLTSSGTDGRRSLNSGRVGRAVLLSFSARLEDPAIGIFPVFIDLIVPSNVHGGHVLPDGGNTPPTDFPIIVSAVVSFVDTSVDGEAASDRIYRRIAAVFVGKEILVRVYVVTTVPHFPPVPQMEGAAVSKCGIVRDKDGVGLREEDTLGIARVVLRRSEVQTWLGIGAKLLRLFLVV